jgi:hypothetical protein
MPASARPIRWNIAVEHVCDVRLFPGIVPTFWGYHQSIIVRSGDRVYAGIIDPLSPTDVTQKQYHLLERSELGWQKIYATDPEVRLNQPPLLLVDAAGHVHAFAWEDGICNHLRVDTDADPRTPVRDTPETGFEGLWPYAGGAVNADGDLLVVTSPYPEHPYAFYDAGTGEWTQGTAVAHPPRPDTRQKFDTHCYPFVALTGREAHILSLQDVSELYRINEGPHERYSHRSIDYYYAPNLGDTPFLSISVVDLEDTKGAAHNDDLLVDRSGTIHVLYRYRQIESDWATASPLMHAHGPPGGPLTHVALVDTAGESFGESRLWEAPDGVLYVVGPRGTQWTVTPLGEDGALAGPPVPLDIGLSDTQYTSPRIFLVPARATTSGSPFLEGLYQEQQDENTNRILYFRATPVVPDP